MTAASPGRRTATAPTIYHDAPQQIPMCCPACSEVDALVLIAETPVEYAVDVWAQGVSRPGFDVAAITVPEPAAAPTTITAIRCDNCRWAYTGPEPLARLREVQ